MHVSNVQVQLHCQRSLCRNHFSLYNSISFRFLFFFFLFFQCPNNSFFSFFSAGFHHTRPFYHMHVSNVQVQLHCERSLCRNHFSLYNSISFRFLFFFTKIFLSPTTLDFFFFKNHAGTRLVHLLIVGQQQIIGRSARRPYSSLYFYRARDRQMDWDHVSIRNKFRQFPTKYDNFRQLATINDTLRQYPTPFDKFRQFPTNFDNLRQISTIFNKFRQGPTRFDKFRQFSTNFDNLRQLSTIFDKFRQILPTPYIHSFLVRPAPDLFIY